MHLRIGILLLVGVIIVLLWWPRPAHPLLIDASSDTLNQRAG